MFRSRGSQRLPQSQPQSSWTWESFCREEAREAATAFIDKVRRFKSWNVQAREVHDSVFTNEFSAAFLEESSELMASGRRNGGGNTFTTSLPTSVHGGVNTRPDSNHREPTNNHTSTAAAASGSKSWWSGLLKWTRSRRGRDRSSSGSSVSSSSPNRSSATLGSSTRHRRRNVKVIKETGNVQLLNLNEQEDQDVMRWSLCRLVLGEQQDNYQLEIYSPPKSSVPKMSLFCFLIEEVRAASRLEIPDSESCIVVKSQNHGEYVFDVRTTSLKQDWITLLQAHSSSPPHTANGHVARSTGLSSHVATLPRAPPSQNSSPLRRSGRDPAQPTAASTLQSSPLMVSRSYHSSDRNPSPAENSTSTNPQLHRGVSNGGMPVTTTTEDTSTVEQEDSEQVPNGGSQSIASAEPPRAAGPPTALLTVDDNLTSRTSQESLMVDMASFMRDYSISTSPSRRRRTMSMFVDPSTNSSTESSAKAKKSDKSTANGEVDRAGMSASYPYGSPQDDSPPPPLPSRGNRRSLSTKVRPSSKKNVPLPPLPLLQGAALSHQLSTGNSPNLDSSGAMGIGSGSSKGNVTNGRKLNRSVADNVPPPLPPPRVNSASPRNFGDGMQSPLQSPAPTTVLPAKQKGSLCTSPVDKSPLGLVHPSVGKSNQESTAWPSSSRRNQSVSPLLAGGACSPSEQGVSSSVPASSPSLENGEENLGSIASGGCGSCPHIPEVEEDGMEEETEVCDLKDGADAGVVNGGIQHGHTSEEDMQETGDRENVKSPPLTLQLDTTNAAIAASPSPDEHHQLASNRKAITPDFTSHKKIGHLRNSSCGAAISPSHLLEGSRMSSNLNDENEEERGSHATLTFPTLSQQHSSPAQFHTATRSSRENVAESPADDQQLLSPVEASGFQTEMSSRHPRHPSPALPSPSQQSRTLPSAREPSRRQSSDHTNSSVLSIASSSDTHGEPSSSNPIFVETTDGQDYGQVAMHTTHPYEYWATNRQDMDNLRQLSQFPWFHGMISRDNATQLVLANHEAGTGHYLVRQSESREGDFVLTFNYHNRAKHLRLAVDNEGCQVQHLTFASVTAMLDYFKNNSIPLESFYLNDDVKLTTYIDRSASDSFRTTTVLNVDQLNRVPPRRSRSLHLAMTRSVAASRRGANGGGGPGSGGSSNSSSTNSLSQGRVATGWRQIFRSQRSSSAGNVGRVQRSHSHNAGSLQRVAGAGSTGHHGSGENTYVWRNY